MKIYLCGPITGRPNLNRAAFRAAKKDLQAKGYDVINPLDHVPANLPWYLQMRLAIGLMVCCDGVALLDGYQDSRGAMIEYDLAEPLKLDVRELEGWE